MIYNWQPIRRLIGGRWATVSGLMWGKNWTRPGSEEKAEEDWARPGWKAPLDWLTYQYDRATIPLSFFWVLRGRVRDDFIIVYSRTEPCVFGYYVDTRCLTPLGCRKAIRASKFFDALCNHIGPDGIRAVVNHGKTFKRGPQP